jgi:hypothetical protein
VKLDSLLANGALSRRRDVSISHLSRFRREKYTRKELIMMRTIFRITIVCFLAVSLAQVALPQQVANVAGKWEVIIKMPDRTVTEQWTIQQENNKLTGMVKRDSGEVPMTGEVSTLEFRASVMDGDMQYKVLATIDTDSHTMDGAVRMGKNEYLWSAKRPK